jgi:hypothetical protein
MQGCGFFVTQQRDKGCLFLRWVADQLVVDGGGRVHGNASCSSCLDFTCGCGCSVLARGISFPHVGGTVATSSMSMKSSGVIEDTTGASTANKHAARAICDITPYVWCSDRENHVMR